MPSVDIFAVARGRKSFFGLAKRSVKRSLVTCQKKILKLSSRHDAVRHEPLIASDETPKLDAVRKLVPIVKNHEKKNKKVDVERPSIVLPYVCIKSDIRGNFELQCDHLDLVMEHVLNDCRGLKHLGDAVTFQLDNAPLVFKTIISSIDGVKELVLDTAWNLMIMQTIVDYYQAANEFAQSPQRFAMENLSIIGSTKINDMDVLSSLLMLTRRTLTSLQMRYCTLHTAEQSLRLWTAVGQCSRLVQLQYEPYKLDSFSRPYLVDVVSRKKMTSLILTDIGGLTQTDVLTMAKGGCLTELAVLGERIYPTIYTTPEARRALSKLNSLLIQLMPTFDLGNCESRASLVQLLQQLPRSSVLEVIHYTKSNVADTARIISYWLRLTNDTDRYVMLKLENCSQERQDAAVGRVLRKCHDAQKSDCSESGISLSLSCGEVVVLDKKTWFGDDF
ncbi:unnamed protein product [Caenorhabditis auriculariae]|uniref:Uncharacterized protein n=1 Tax=Caenorhabditis auriculariae TaxID=2777116 RepID=A0A8S1HNF3_9PELO|nr:unnamed protein product [Caenorhabditis auriculariae]